ncbi:unnamed protein product [Dicrocoelium dendriticum]|nr:unnamed protein product [Dicrocoelium dendriticum]
MWFSFTIHPSIYFPAQLPGLLCDGKYLVPRRPALALVEKSKKIWTAPIMLRGVLLCWISLLGYAYSDRDPFDMFSDTVSSKLSPAVTSEPHAPIALSEPVLSPIAVTSEPTHPVTVSSAITAAEHYKELHRVLVRIFWNRIQFAETIAPNGKQAIRLQLIASLAPDDLIKLKRYCSFNETVAKSVSPDIINSLFSRLFQSVSEAPDASASLFRWPHWLHQKNIIGIGLLLIVLLIMVTFMGVRRFLWLIVPSLVITGVLLQSLIKKYHERLAEKMSVLSKYRNPPEECKPPHLQSWFLRFSKKFSLSPSHDECALYYEHVVTDTWVNTNFLEAFWEAVLVPCVSFGKMFGKSLGLFYANLVTHVPVIVAIPMSVLCFTVLIITIFAFWRFLPSHPRKNNLVNKRKHKKCLKTQPAPSMITSE